MQNMASVRLAIFCSTIFVFASSAFAQDVSFVWKDREHDSALNSITSAQRNTIGKLKAAAKELNAYYEVSARVVPATPTVDAYFQKAFSDTPLWSGCKYHTVADSKEARPAIRPSVIELEDLVLSVWPQDVRFVRKAIRIPAEKTPEMCYFFKAVVVTPDRVAFEVELDRRDNTNYPAN